MQQRREFDPWREWFDRTFATWLAAWRPQMSCYMLMKRMEEARTLPLLTSIVRWRKNDIEAITKQSSQDGVLLRNVFIANAERITGRPWYEIVNIIDHKKPGN